VTTPLIVISAPLTAAPEGSVTVPQTSPPECYGVLLIDLGSVGTSVYMGDLGCNRRHVSRGHGSILIAHGQRVADHEQRQRCPRNWPPRTERDPSWPYKRHGLYGDLQGFDGCGIQDVGTNDFAVFGRSPPTLCPTLLQKPPTPTHRCARVARMTF
jgi:hypothetical protein